MGKRLIDPEQFKPLIFKIIDQPDTVIHLGQSFDDSGTQAQGTLDLLFLPHFFIHVLETGNDPAFSVFKIQLRKFQTVIANAAAENTPEGHRIDLPVFRIPDDAFLCHSTQEFLPVFFQYQTGIKGKGIRELCDLHCFFRRQKMCHFIIDPEQFKCLGPDIADQPDTVIHLSQRFDHGRAKIKRMPDPLFTSYFIVDIFESDDDFPLIFSEIEIDKLHPVITDGIIEYPSEENGIQLFVLRIPVDILRLYRFQKALAVFFRNHRRIKAERIRKLPDFFRFDLRKKMNCAFGNPEQFKLLRIQIIDDPYRVIHPGKGCDDGRVQRSGGFILFMPVGDIREKHVIQAMINIGLHIMSVVIHPPDRPVFADDAVFHMIEIRFAFPAL